MRLLRWLRLKWLMWKANRSGSIEDQLRVWDEINKLKQSPTNSDTSHARE